MHMMVYGSGFTGATTLRFGDVYVAGWQIKSDGSIDALVPPGTGTVDITVTTPGGTSVTSIADQFTYGTSAITTTVPGTTTGPTAAPATGGSGDASKATGTSGDAGSASGGSGSGQVNAMPSIPATSADAGTNVTGSSEPAAAGTQVPAQGAVAPTTKASPDVPPAIIVTAGVFGLALTGFGKRNRWH
jgi:hypothetical protein